jgi:hypothetical protein
VSAATMTLPPPNDQARALADSVWLTLVNKIAVPALMAVIAGLGTWIGHAVVDQGETLAVIAATVNSHSRQFEDIAKGREDAVHAAIAAATESGAAKAQIDNLSLKVDEIGRRLDRFESLRNPAR